ncbi:HET-domain-containing protein [Hypomontagnella monticulosa]|nr:HET-domain-containing protein [Hypomontagnella monticulosa]
MMAEPYVHEPLPSARSIRLLSLSPSRKPDAPIQCDITIIELPDRPGKVPYEALSYVWGSLVGTIPIQCRGRELLVTPNCHDALRQLRFRFSRRTLWIDSICIDQGNSERQIRERKSQVQMMGDIYESASRVIVWLGPAHQYTPMVFHVLRMTGLVTYWSRKYHLGWRATKPLYLRISSRFEYDATESRKYTEGLRYLLDNQWFNRVWTMQETIFAGKCVILCGKNQLDWEAFGSSLSHVNGLFAYSPAADSEVISLLTARDMARDRFQPRKKTATRPVAKTPIGRDKIPFNRRYSFKHLDHLWMAILGRLQCSVPQDKVYGLYSVFKANGFELPDVDYSKSVQEVYGDVIKSFISHHRSLDILSVSVRPLGPDDFPTWAPNWNISYTVNPRAFDSTEYLFSPWFEYCASGNSMAGITGFTPAEELHLRGLIVGCVRSIVVSSTPRRPSDLAARSNPSLDFIRTCHSWLAQLKSTRVEEVYQGVAYVKALMNTVAFINMPRKEITMDSEKRKELEVCFHCWVDVLSYPDCDSVVARGMEAVAQLDPSSANYLEIIEAALDFDKIMSKSNTIPRAVIEILFKAQRFDYTVCSRLSEWAFLFLETGHIGRSYYNCREGDKIALLAGSTVPLVLREVGHNRYQFVSPAYIHGIMKGELWPTVEEGVEDIILV